MKLALGLFHFNVHDVAGEPAASHRYCTQVILPFLRAIAFHPQFRATFEIAGIGLEFLAEHYPNVIDLLRQLISQNKIELISSTYAPTLWVAFPRRDLERSIKLNEKVLDSLQLPRSHIFSAQEGFFGPGLKVVSDWFDTAVCKDDVLRLFANGAGGRPFYKLGKINVVVGANHLLHELAGRIVKESEEGHPRELSSFYEARVQEAVNTSTHSGTEYVEGIVGDLRWHWYHMGSGHHFTTTGVPQNWESFFCDPEWVDLNCGVLQDLLEDGYQLSFISELTRRLVDLPAEQLPLSMIESSWNPIRTRGVFGWMGRQEHRWMSGGSLLTLAWRARKTLRESELAIDLISSADQRRQAESQIEEIWKHQIIAESSDPLGWSPLPCEVNFARDQSDQVFRMCAAFSPGLPSEATNSRLPDQRASAMIDPGAKEVPLAAEFVGAEGTLVWRTPSTGTHLCEARFRAEEHSCGIRFQREWDSIVYCPSGCEESPVRFALGEFPQPDFYLPLANGFISLSEDLHLIRNNCSVAVAAHIVKDDPWITFAVEGAPDGRLFEWRFLVVRGSVDMAVRTANEMNCI